MARVSRVSPLETRERLIAINWDVSIDWIRCNSALGFEYFHSANHYRAMKSNEEQRRAKWMAVYRPVRSFKDRSSLEFQDLKSLLPILFEVFKSPTGPLAIDWSSIVTREFTRLESSDSNREQVNPAKQCRTVSSQSSKRGDVWQIKRRAIHQSN